MVWAMRGVFVAGLVLLAVNTAASLALRRLVRRDASAGPGAKLAVTA